MGKSWENNFLRTLRHARCHLLTRKPTAFVPGGARVGSIEFMRQNVAFFERGLSWDF
jgi:hypothetical protein